MCTRGRFCTPIAAGGSTGAGVYAVRRLRGARLPGQNGKAQSARARCRAKGWWRRGKKSSDDFFHEEETFSLFARAWQVSHVQTHLAGKRPISRQVEHFLALLTGYDGDCRSVPAMTERVRGDGGEEGKGVSTIFFMRRKLFPLREGRFPVRSGITRVSVKGEFKKESLPGGEGFRLIPWRRSGCLG